MSMRLRWMWAWIIRKEVLKERPVIADEFPNVFNTERLGVFAMVDTGVKAAVML